MYISGGSIILSIGDLAASATGNITAAGGFGGAPGGGGKHHITTHIYRIDMSHVSYYFNKHHVIMSSDAHKNDVLSL